MNEWSGAGSPSVPRSTVTPGDSPSPGGAAFFEEVMQAVQIDQASKYLALLKSGRDMRVELVRRVKDSIRQSRYENELKTVVTAERLATWLSDSR